MTRGIALEFIFMVALLCGQPAAARPCNYAALDPATGRFTFDGMRFDLGEADNPAQPAAWQGPITIARDGGPSCTVDAAVSIVERPIFSDGKHLLVTTYSGSNKTVFAIDVATCRMLWRSAPFAGEIVLKSESLQTGRRSAKLGQDCVP